jgi:hypothetical protein
VTLCRRSFLAGLAALVSTPTAVIAGNRFDDGQADLVSRLKRLIRNRESAFLVGASVLECCGSLSHERLVHALLERNDAFRLARSQAALAQRLRDAITRDFEHERTWSVRGLVLAQTEASLCALIALERIGRP